MQNIFETSVSKLSSESVLENFKCARSSSLKAYIVLWKQPEVNQQSNTAKYIVPVKSMSLD